jgi:hypothetical protein
VQHNRNTHVAFESCCAPLLSRRAAEIRKARVPAFTTMPEALPRPSPLGGMGSNRSISHYNTIGASPPMGK